MSSMVKKKGLLGKTFKPKAPQARRPTPASASASTRPSTETTSQSQIPAPIVSAEASKTHATQELSSSSDHRVAQPSESDAGRGQESVIQASPATSAQSQDPTPQENTLKRSSGVEKNVSQDEHTSEPPTKKARILPPQPGQNELSRPSSTQVPVAEASTIILETPTNHPTASSSQPVPSIESQARPLDSSTEDGSTAQNTSNIDSSNEASQHPTTTITNADLPNKTSQHPETPIPNAAVDQLRDPATRESTQDTQVDVDLSAMGPGQASRGSHIVPSAALNPDGTSGVSLEEPEKTTSKGKKKAVAKRKKIQPQEGDIRATIEIQLHRPKRAIGEKRARKKKEGDKKKRRRAKTPEGAEEESLPAGITIGDLCKDIRIGKKFSKHDEIRQKDNQKKIKAKLAKALLNMAPGESGEGNAASTASAREGAALEDEAPAQSANETIQMKVVNGQIVIEERSLRHDMHVRSDQVEEVVEENEFTRLITAGTYMKREKAQVWTVPDTDLFYKCLRSYGTDFEMISTHFPHRTRRQIKLKFNAEEKANSARITRTLIGTPEPIDIDEHQARAGFEYEEVKDIEAQAREKEEAQQAEQQKELDKQAEAIRRKKEEIARSGGQGSLGDSSRENGGEGGEASAAPRSRKKGVTKNPVKHKHSAHGGGEEVEIVGTVER